MDHLLLVILDGFGVWQRRSLSVVFPKGRTVKIQFLVDTRGLVERLQRLYHSWKLWLSPTIKTWGGYYWYF